MEQVMELDIILPLEQLKLITDFMLNLPLKMEEIQILCGQQYVGKQWGRLTLQNNPVNISLPISLIDLFVAFATSNDAGQTNVYRVNPSIANAKDLKIVSVNLPPEPKQGMYVVVGR